MSDTQQSRKIVTSFNLKRKQCAECTEFLPCKCVVPELCTSYRIVWPRCIKSRIHFIDLQMFLKKGEFYNAMIYLDCDKKELFRATYRKRYSVCDTMQEQDILKRKFVSKHWLLGENDRLLRSNV